MQKAKVVNVDTEQGIVYLSTKEGPYFKRVPTFVAETMHKFKTQYVLVNNEEPCLSLSRRPERLAGRNE
jgi:hypothetical protein